MVDKYIVKVLLVYLNFKVVESVITSWMDVIGNCEALSMSSQDLNRTISEMWSFIFLVCRLFSLCFLTFHLKGVELDSSSRFLIFLFSLFGNEVTNKSSHQ